MSFFSGRNRVASARASDFTTLFTLNRNDFLKILEKYSDDLVYNYYFPSFLH